MASRRPKWQLITALAGACFLSAAGVGYSQFTSFNDRMRLNAILEGNWQSCREGDGTYSERVYDGNIPGLGPFELHLGPYHDFALFRGQQDAHRDHTASDDLFRPHTVDTSAATANQHWDVAGLHFEVTLAGGSREDCESWFILLRRADNPSSH